MSTETPNAVPLAASQNEYLAERCRTYWDDHTRDQATAAELQTVLKEMVSPEVYTLIIKAIEADAAAATSWAWAMAAELARHLPGVAPAIPHLWEHVATIHRDDVGVCCVLKDPKS